MTESSVSCLVDRDHGPGLDLDPDRDRDPDLGVHLLEFPSAPDPRVP